MYEKDVYTLRSMHSAQDAIHQHATHHYTYLILHSSLDLMGTRL